MSAEDVCKQIRERQEAAQYTFFKERHAMAIGKDAV